MNPLELSQKALDQFIALSNDCTEKRLVVLIQQIIKHKSIYAFKAFKETSSYKEISNKSDISKDTTEHLALLELFSHKKYSDFIAFRNNSSEPMRKFCGNTDVEMKILKLTLLRICSERNGFADKISYGKIEKELGIENQARIEDIIFGCVNEGLLGCKIDQNMRNIQIDFCFKFEPNPLELPSRKESIITQFMSNYEEVSTEIDFVLEEFENRRKIKALSSASASTGLLNKVPEPAGLAMVE